jgi:hypothetical protein
LTTVGNGSFAVPGTPGPYAGVPRLTPLTPHWSTGPVAPSWATGQANPTWSQGPAAARDAVAVRPNLPTRGIPAVAPGLWDQIGTTVSDAVRPTAITAELATFQLWNRLRSAFGVSGTAVAGAGTLQLASGGGTTTRHVSPQELRRLGQTDKQAFFRALLPAALLAEKHYGVPVSVTLAQAAIESGWGKSPIGGYNIFGIKGSGTAGTTKVWTTDETKSGVRFRNYTNFAVYRDLEDAVMAHGKLFHNGYYDKGMKQFAKDHDPYRFLKNIAGTYANGAKYDAAVSKVMKDFNLVALAKSVGGT